MVMMSNSTIPRIRGSPCQNSDVAVGVSRERVKQEPNISLIAEGSAAQACADENEIRDPNCDFGLPVGIYIPRHNPSVKDRPSGRHIYMKAVRSYYIKYV